MRPLRVGIRNVRGARDVRDEDVTRDQDDLRPDLDSGEDDEVRLDVAVRDVEVHLRPFTALIGPNNVGKSTLLDAIRLFYGALDWDPRRDRPWDVDAGEMSWVQIDYELTDEEVKSLDLELTDEQIADGLDPLDGNLLRVRRVLSGGPSHATGLYYVGADGTVAEPIGWDPAGKLGQCVYVPAVTRVQDQTSLAGPSPLRDVLLLAFATPQADGGRMVANSSLQGILQTLNSGLLRRLKDSLDEALSPWGLSANIEIGELTDEFIIRNLINLTFQYRGTPLAMDTQGSGVQRSLIAALIQAAAQVQEDSANNSFRWVLFEEPEAFLHPAQVSRLAQDLRRITSSGNTAVTITTHDPTMLSASETSPEGIARVQRYGTRTRVTTPSPETVDRVLAAIHLRSCYGQAATSNFRRLRDTTAAEERARVLYDLDPRRASAFFAERVIVVEGFSDAVFFEWLERRGHLAALGANIGVLDAGGKYELHRAVSTLSLFGIPHIVLWDEDAAMPGLSPATRANRLVQDEAALETLKAAAAGSPLEGAVRLNGTIEHWLGITEERSNAWKAANLGSALTEAFDDPASAVPGRVRELLSVVGDLFDGREPRAKDRFPGCLITRRLGPPTVDLVAEVARIRERSVVP